MTAAERPHLRVVRGDLTPEEIAALVAALAAASPAQAEQAPATPRTASLWGQPGRQLRRPLPLCGWWASSLPG